MYSWNFIIIIKNDRRIFYDVVLHNSLKFLILYKFNFYVCT